MKKTLKIDGPGPKCLTKRSRISATKFEFSSEFCCLVKTKRPNVSLKNKKIYGVKFLKWDFIHVFKTDISVAGNQENFRECTGVVFKKSQNSNSIKTSTLNLFNFTSQKNNQIKKFQRKIQILFDSSGHGVL